MFIVINEHLHWANFERMDTAKNSARNFIAFIDREMGLETDDQKKISLKDSKDKLLKLISDLELWKKSASLVCPKLKRVNRYARNY